MKNIAMIFERLTRIMTSQFHHGWAGQSVIQLSLLVYFLTNILMFASLRVGTGEWSTMLYCGLWWTVGGLLYGQWWSMAVYWQSIGLRLSVGGHRGRSSVPSWLRSRDFRSLSAPLLLLHPTCCRAVGLKRRAVASLEREQTLPAISTLSQLTR